MSTYTPRWRTGRSCANAACVEVASVPGAMLVRDSKDVDGGVLTFDRAGWGAFVAALKSDQVTETAAAALS